MSMSKVFPRKWHTHVQKDYTYVYACTHVKPWEQTRTEVYDVQIHSLYTVQSDMKIKQFHTVTVSFKI